MNAMQAADNAGLNPCFNGRYSQSHLYNVFLAEGSLNPCFNGRYSQRAIMIITLVCAFVS